MEIKVLTKLTTYASADIEVPVESWDQIEDWFIEGDALVYRAKGCTEYSRVDLHSVVDDELVNWDEVGSVQIFPCVDDVVDYDNPLEEELSYDKGD